MKGCPSEADAAAKGVEQWLVSVGAPEKLSDVGFTAADIDQLDDIAYTTPSLGYLLTLAPNKADRDAVREIYTNSLTPLNK